MAAPTPCKNLAPIKLTAPVASEARIEAKHYRHSTKEKYFFTAEHVRKTAKDENKHRACH
jgi:hypothetical protein